MLNEIILFKRLKRKNIDVENTRRQMNKRRNFSKKTGSATNGDKKPSTECEKRSNYFV